MFLVSRKLTVLFTVLSLLSYTLRSFHLHLQADELSPKEKRRTLLRFAKLLWLLLMLMLQLLWPLCSRGLEWQAQK